MALEFSNFYRLLLPSPDKGVIATPYWSIWLQIYWVRGHRKFTSFYWKGNVNYNTEMCLEKSHWLIRNPTKTWVRKHVCSSYFSLSQWLVVSAQAWNLIGKHSSTPQTHPTMKILIFNRYPWWLICAVCLSSL